MDYEIIFNISMMIIFVCFLMMPICVILKIKG